MTDATIVDLQAKLAALSNTSAAEIEGLRARVIELAGEPVIVKEDECPWCTTRIDHEAVGGMAPFDLAGTLWHQGCVADLDRSTREVPNATP